MSRAATDPNRKPTMIAVSENDAADIVQLTADPLTGALNVSTVASIGTQYDSGDTTPATPTGTIQVFDNAGTIAHVSNTVGLPVQVLSSALPSGAATAANQLPDGHNVTIDNDSIAVTGTFWQATQPISASALPLPTGAATAANQQTDALTDTELRATPVPVSGTVTANAGTNLNTSSLALESGGNLATVAGAVSGSEMQVDVVAALPTGSNTIGSVGLVADDFAVGSVGLNADSFSPGTGINVGAFSYVSTGSDWDRLKGEDGRVVTQPYAETTAFLSGTASATNTSDTSIIAAQGAGVRIYVTSIIISNSSETDTEVVIKSATTALATYPAPAQGGAVHALPTPLRLTANEALNFASLASVTTMKVTAIGYSAA